MSLAVKRGKRRGDPGLWSTALQVGQGVLTGGFAGGASALTRSLGLGGGPQLPALQINPPFGGAPGAGVTLRGPGGFSLEAGVGEIGEAARMLQNGGGANGKTPPGYHWNKTGYFTKGPPVEYHPAGTKLVRNRRRNPLNPRAFDRALGRVSSAKRFAAKLGKVTIRKACTCKKPQRKP